MIRPLSFLTIVLVAFASEAIAQDWTSDLFTEHEHDFGTVARAAKAEYEFKITNTTDQEIHIAGVRTSCGCTTPKITKETLAPGETGSILSVFNTRNFLGQRAATITVTFDRPTYREVQLRIRGYVRRDIVIDPGLVKFGTVTEGDEAEQTVKIDYAGRSDWKILDVVSTDDNIRAELVEKERTSGLASYELKVFLKPGTTSGYFNKELTIVTNDSRETSQRIPLLVEGRVAAGVTVSPASLYLGEMEMGQQVTRQFVVRANKPFKILNVAAKGSDEGLTFKADEESKALHVIVVTFSPQKPGKLEQQIKVETDLDGNTEATCTALADVTNQASLD